MSLDVYLTRKKWISYDEGKTYTEETEELFWANITHNLGVMARAAGIYDALWHPESIPAFKAKEISTIIEKGLIEMKGDTEKYSNFNAVNGWGTLKQFIPWIENYLQACKEYPEAEVYTST